MEQDNTETTYSKYNAGVAIQIRLDSLWKLVNQYSIDGQFKKWNSVLDRIWSELARDIKQTEFEDDEDKEGKKIKGYNTRFNEFDNELKKLGSFDDNIVDSFNKIKKEDIEKRAKQYEVLMAKDLFLKRLENHLGKGTAWDDHDDDDF